MGSLLESHPAIYWDGEHLLHLRKSQGLTKLRRRFAWHYPLSYLRYRARRMGHPVYGCKLAIHYCRDLEQLLQQLPRHNWRLIHLWRRDIFQETLSGCVAHLNHHHQSYHQSRDIGTEAKIRIEPHVFLSQLGRRMRMHEQERHLLVDLPHTGIIYEDDLAESTRWDETTGRVFDALGLTQRTVQSLVKKTWTRPYTEFVENYTDLEKIFWDSQWSQLGET